MSRIELFSHQHLHAQSEVLQGLDLREQYRAAIQARNRWLMMNRAQKRGMRVPFRIYKQ